MIATRLLAGSLHMATGGSLRYDVLHVHVLHLLCFGERMAEALGVKVVAPSSLLLKEEPELCCSFRAYPVRLCEELPNNARQLQRHCIIQKAISAKRAA